MNLYILSHSDHDSYCPSMFLHNENKTQERFESDVKSLIEKHFDELFIEEYWIGASRVIDLVSSKLSDLGYYAPNFISMDAFGAGIVEDPNDKEDSEFAKKFLSEDMFDRIIEHNKQVREKIHEERINRDSGDNRPVRVDENNPV